jgi:hypothetical protein
MGSIPGLEGKNKQKKEVKMGISGIRIQYK